MQTEDGQIISQCLNGDSAMFGFLVEKYKQGVYAFAYSKLGNFHDAQDITQEAFIKAYQKLHTLKKWDTFALWLSAITNNLCKNFIKSKSKRPDRDFIDDQSPDIVEHGSMDSYRDDLLSESLQESLNSMPEIYRQVLMLHYFSGYKNMDIAQMLGISLRTVVERLRIGRERLKEEMIVMMSATFKEQKLPAGFTFRIVEIVKRIKINPITQTKGLPWGLSLAAGIIIATLSLNPYMPFFSQLSAHISSILPSETKVLKIGEIPVDVVKTSSIPTFSGNMGKGNGMNPKQPDMQNAFFLAPQGEEKWVNKADMPTARFAICTAVVNGKIYAIGGQNFNSTLSTVEEYDPIENKWEIRSSMPQAKMNHCASSVNGKIYAFGGNLDANFNSSLSVYEYELALDRWTAKKDMPNGLWASDSCALGPKMYVFGGVDKNGWSTNLVYEYDPAEDSWTEKANMPTERGGLRACPVNGKIYVIGGINSIGEAVLAVEEYDPVADSWKKRFDMPTKRTHFAACAVGTKIYVMGGRFNDQYLTTVEIYDALTDTWAKGIDMQIPRGSLPASVVGGKIYSIGGYNGNNVLSVVEEFDTGFISKSVDPSGKLPKTWGNLKSR